MMFYSLGETKVIVINMKKINDLAKERAMEKAFNIAYEEGEAPCTNCAQEASHTITSIEARKNFKPKNIKS